MQKLTQWRLPIIRKKLDLILLLRAPDAKRVKALGIHFETVRLDYIATLIVDNLKWNCVWQSGRILWISGSGGGGGGSGSGGGGGGGGY